MPLSPTSRAPPHRSSAGAPRNARRAVPLACVAPEPAPSSALTSNWVLPPNWPPPSGRHHCRLGPRAARNFTVSLSLWREGLCGAALICAREGVVGDRAASRRVLSRAPSPSSILSPIPAVPTGMPLLGPCCREGRNSSQVAGPQLRARGASPPPRQLSRKRRQAGVAPAVVNFARSPSPRAGPPVGPLDDPIG
eukprot:365273-Chlamydomonas_euryale.AAC.2